MVKEISVGDRALVGLALLPLLLLAPPPLPLGPGPEAGADPPELGAGLALAAVVGVAGTGLGLGLGLALMAGTLFVGLLGSAVGTGRSTCQMSRGTGALVGAAVRTGSGLPAALAAASFWLARRVCSAF